MHDLGSWPARLALSFRREGARTALAERSHHGPLRVQRPFYPEGDATCHVYLLHPPGGVVSGDQLAIEVQVGAGAHALLTTPAANKLYRRRELGPRAELQQRLRVGAGAVLEWLPQETIAFDGARAELATTIELAPDARFIGWEVLCLGRPAAAESFRRGELSLRIELTRGERLLYRERGRYAGGDPVLDAAWGLRGLPVVGSFVCAGRDLSAHAVELRAALRGEAGEADPDPARPHRPAEPAAISCMGELTVARYLGPSTEAARAAFARLWSCVRPHLLDLPASPPRIWLS